MRSVSATATIDVPRDVVFDYLCDLANHAEFTDHFIEEFRLERLDSRGTGAAASFRLDCPLRAVWAEIVLAELERPHRIAIEGRAGRLARIAVKGEWRLTTRDPGMTRVEFTVSTVPATATDRLREALGSRLWLRGKLTRALRRMRRILEEGEPSAGAVRVAAG